MKKLQSRPESITGVNILTPQILGYYSLEREGKTLYAELSRGDFLGTTIFGVTVRPTAEDGSDPFSQPFTSEVEARDYLKSLEQ